MIRIAVAAALLSACPARTVTRPVVVREPPCLVRPAPLAPADAPTCGARWADYYVELSAWIVEVEASCGAHLFDPASSDRH